MQFENLKSPLEIGLGITICYHVEITFLLSTRGSGLRKRGLRNGCRIMRCSYHKYAYMEVPQNLSIFKG